MTFYLFIASQSFLFSQNILDPKDEDEAESQTVLIGDKAVKVRDHSAKVKIKGHN